MNTPSLTLTKTLLGLVAVATFSPALHAQDSIEIDEARKAARKLSEAGARISDAPFAVDVDLDKPQGIKASGVGLIVLPDRKCSSELLAAANSAITPLGQLWTLKLAVATDGKATAAEKLRRFTVGDGEKEREVSLYYLGATKSAAGELELVVYGKGEQPLIRVPINKRVAAKQEYPIEVSGAKNDENTATLSLRLFGEYDARLQLTRDE
jgi:hypothetical protein